MRGILSSSVPATMAPSSTRKTLRSPSQPSSVLPSKSDVGFCAAAGLFCAAGVTAATIAIMTATTPNIRITFLLLSVVCEDHIRGCDESRGIHLYAAIEFFQKYFSATGRGSVEK